MTKSLRPLIIIFFFISLTTGGCGPDEKAQEQVQRGIANAEKEAATIIEDAKTQAAEIIQKAQKAVKDAHEDHVTDLLGGATPYPGDNQWVDVGQRYVVRFRVSGGDQVEYRVSNANKYGDVKPRFAVIFYDENGVQSGISNIIWLITRVSPGESRDETTSLSRGPSKKKSLYFKVEFTS